jgi:hypothetical protein
MNYGMHYGMNFIIERQHPMNSEAWLGAFMVAMSLAPLFATYVMGTDR